MRPITRLGTVLSAGVLASGGVMVAGVGTAQAGFCGSGYPPAGCNIYFRNAHFHPGQDVSFYTDPGFHRHEWVSGHVTCVGASWETHKFQANDNQRVNNAFKISKKCGAGAAELTLNGNQGETMTGSFTVTLRHHH